MDKGNRIKRLLEQSELVEYEACAEWVIYVEENDSGDLGGGYYSDLDAYIEACQEDEIEPAEFVFATTSEKPKFNVERVIECCIGDCDPEVRPETFRGYDDLKKAIEAFHSKQNWKFHDVDYSRKIKVPRPSVEGGQGNG